MTDVQQPVAIGKQLGVCNGLADSCPSRRRCTEDTSKYFAKIEVGLLQVVRKFFVALEEHHESSQERGEGIFFPGLEINFGQ